LTSSAREIFRPREEGSQRVLAVCGYRFGDSHINLELDSALRESEGRLTVVAFSSASEPDGVLKQWHDDPQLRDRVLIYAKGGFWHGDTIEKVVNRTSVVQV